MLKLIVVIEDCSEELRKAPSMKYSVNMGSMQPYGKRFPSHMFPCELFNFFSKQLLYRTPVNGCFLPLPFSYICQNCVLKCQTYFTFLALTSNLPSVSYSETCQTCKMEYFAKIVNGFETLTIFAKRSVLDVWQGFEYASSSHQIFTISGNNISFSRNINSSQREQNYKHVHNILRIFDG